MYLYTFLVLFAGNSKKSINCFRPKNIPKLISAMSGKKLFLIHLTHEFNFYIPGLGVPVYRNGKLKAFGAGFRLLLGSCYPSPPFTHFPPPCCWTELKLLSQSDAHCRKHGIYIVMFWLWTLYIKSIRQNVYIFSYIDDKNKWARAALVVANLACKNTERL